MRHKIINKGLSAICLLTLSPFPSLLEAQTSDERASEIARKAVVETGFLSVHRREDLEDIFHSVARKGSPQIFEISNQGYEFKENGVGFHFSVHGPLVRFVAVDLQTGNTFRISGFEDAQNEFNRMAGSYQVKLGDELQARDYAKLYLQLDPPHNQIDTVQSLISLKHLAERRFNEVSKDFATAEPQFERWWNKYERASARIPLAESVVPTQKGFAFTCMTLSSIDKKQPERGPAPLKVTLTLSQDGQVDAPTFTPVALN